MEEVFPSSSCIDINPLDIPHILSNIFENLSVWNLKKSRLVCKFWVQEATPILQKKCKISLKTEDQLAKFKWNLEVPDISRLCQTFDLGNEINLLSDSSQAFFVKFSQVIKSLDLSFHHEYNSTWIQQILPLLCNLEELCLNGRANFLQEDTSIGDVVNVLQKLKFLFIYDSSYDLDGPHARKIWTENVFQILLAAPNLERVFFAPFLETRAKTFFEIVTSEALVHNKISHLHINHIEVSPLEIRSLLNKQFPLKYVHLVLTHHLEREHLNYFLEKLQNTLRELTLTFTDGMNCSKYHPIEHLDNLTKLSLIGYEGPFVISKTGKLNLFVMSLPDVSFVAESITGLNRELKDLEIYDSKAKYVPDNLRILYQNFNNLRSLKMNNVDNDILRTVFANLPTLCELYICFHKFYGVTSVQIDSGLNGISDYRLEECLLDCIDDRNIAHFRSFPWIGNMKHLKLLELELGHLTDFGIVLGIARCSSIRRLSLKNCDAVFDDSTQAIMTNRSIEAIVDMMDLHYLKLDGYNDCFSEDALKKASSLLEGREIYFI